jgi:hypothetical protein
VNATDILQALAQKPFKSFRITLDSGRDIAVVHHDSVLLNESRTTLLVVEGDRWHFVDLEHIAKPSFGGQPTADQLAS